MPAKSLFTVGSVITAATLWCAFMLVPAPAWAGEDPLQIHGKIYNKWLYRNNDRAGVVSLGNPFWPDNITGVITRDAIATWVMRDFQT